MSYILEQMFKCSIKQVFTMSEKTAVKENVSPLDDETVIDLADLFRVFGDSTRIRMLWILRSGEMCVDDLATAAGISMSACSHQLKTLRTADLVEARRDGKRILYRISDDHVHILLSVALEHMQEML